MNEFKKLYHRIRDFCVYSVFGFIASLINIICYWFFRHNWQWQYLIANTVAWIIANVFGFFTNKSIVFKSKYSSIKKFWHEFINFFTLRGLSFFIDTGLMFLGITILRWSSMFVKIIDQVIVGIVNYYFSRFTFIWCNRIMAHPQQIDAPTNELNEITDKD